MHLQVILFLQGKGFFIECVTCCPRPSSNRRHGPRSRRSEGLHGEGGVDEQPDRSFKDKVDKVYIPYQTVINFAPSLHKPCCHILFMNAVN